MYGIFVQARARLGVRFYFLCFLCFLCFPNILYFSSSLTLTFVLLSHCRYRARRRQFSD